MYRIALAVLLAGLAFGPVLLVGRHHQSAFAADRTGKERLTDKSSDEQRVDDCKVPPAKRTRARPTGCHFR